MLKYSHFLFDGLRVKYPEVVTGTNVQLYSYIEYTSTSHGIQF